MLFEEDELSACTGDAAPAPSYPAMSDAHCISVPAQVWEEAAGVYCGHRLADADTGETISVPTFEHGGFLHAIFSCLYGGHSGIYRAEGWQLVPRRAYSGPTINVISFHDEDESVRARGDYTGMVVKVRGTQMVCTKRVHFIRELPTVAALSIQEAMRYDEAQRSCGWRAMKYKHASVRWHSLNGHPVVIYELEENERTLAILLWKSNGVTHEYLLPREMDLQGLHPAPLPKMNVEADCFDTEPQVFQPCLF